MSSAKASAAVESKVGFGFDAFTLKTKENAVALLLLLCKSIDVHKHIQKSDKELVPFFEDVAAHMPANPYHNVTHITDVTQFSSAVIMHTKLFKWLPPLSVVALFFGSVCHDLQHPGSSNVFAINEKTSIAKKFPYDCPLEHHHVAWCKQLLAKHKILSNLAPKDSAAIMQTIEELILSTDMSKHNDIIKNFKEVMEKAKTDCKSVVDSFRKGLLQVLIKSADISNQARPFEAAWKWNIAVYTEFYHEGDVDRTRGRKVNPLHDRNTNIIAKSTVGFINFVVRPLMLLLQQAVKILEQSGAPLSSDALAPLLTNLDANVAINEQRAKTASPGLPKGDE